MKQNGPLLTVADHPFFLKGRNTWARFYWLCQPQGPLFRLFYWEWLTYISRMKLYYESVDFHLLSSLRDVHLNNILATKGFDWLFGVILRRDLCQWLFKLLSVCVCVCVCDFCVYLCVSISGWLLLWLFISFQALPVVFILPLFLFFSFFLVERTCVLSHSVMSDSLRPGGLQSARLLCPWEFSKQEYWRGLLCPPPGNRPNPGIEPRSPAFQADSLSTEPPGKPKNTGVGSLSLLQGIFLTQESNRGFLHCRRVLYQLSCLERTCTF